MQAHQDAAQQKQKGGLLANQQQREAQTVDQIL
jgi:hypothetical protein